MITAYSVSGNIIRERTLICVIPYGFFPVINGLFIDTAPVYRWHLPDPRKARISV